MLPSTFTALDFETAQGYRWSICQVGIVKVVDGVIIDEISVLVQPPNNYYWLQNVNVHGINADTTRFEPTFDGVWEKIRPYIQAQNVVAHNGFSFDFPVLASTLQFYHLEVPEYQKFCTLKIFKKGLKKLAIEHSIPLQHHDALSDARACAHLFMMAQGKELIV